MKILLLKFLVLTSLLFMAPTTFASDQEDADKAASSILSSLQKKDFETVWNKQMSKFFQSKMTKQSFLANMALASQQLGTTSGSMFIDMAYSQIDPATGTKGEIYAFNYLSTYTIAGKIYERVVVIKEADGKFRLAGLWRAPPPK